MVNRTGFQHRTEECQHTIGQASQHTAVTVALAAQTVVVLTTPWIVLHTHARPVIDAITDAEITAVTHQHR